VDRTKTTIAKPLRYRSIQSLLESISTMAFA
jgi:hypothetical protein